MDKKRLRVKEQDDKGRNLSFINEISGRTIKVDQVVDQIKKGNPTYGDYHVATYPGGIEVPRSNPDSNKNNNIE